MPVIMLIMLSSSERESVGPDAGLEEFDLDGPVDNRPGLANELVKPVLPHGSPTACVHAGAVIGAGNSAIDRHAKPHRTLGGSAEDEMEVAGMEAVADPAR